MMLAKILTARDVSASTFAKYWKGTALHATGTLANGRPVDVVAAHNAAFDPDLGTDVGWTPPGRCRARSGRRRASDGTDRIRTEPSAIYGFCSLIGAKTRPR